MKRTGIWLTAALILVLVGAAGFALSMSRLNWDFSALSNVRYESRLVDITEPFQNISIHTDTDDIRFVPSTDGKCRVEFYEQEKITHTAQVRDGTLSIETEDRRSGKERIFSFSLKSPSVTLYLPLDHYAAISIDESTGNVEIPADFRLESVDIAASTGNVSCMASVSGPLRIALSTGNIRLESVTAGTMELTTSTGNVKLGACDAQELTIATNTGNVTGTLRSPKDFIAHSDTGRVELPETTADGVCRITTNTGNIRIEIE